MDPIFASTLTTAFWLALVGIMLLVLPYLVAPLFIKKSFHTPVNPALVPFDTDENPPPIEATRFFDQVRSELTPAGFQLVSHFANSVEYGNVTAFLMLLENRQTNDRALAIVAFALPNSVAPNNRVITEQMLAIRRQFGDGSEITTSNTDVPKIFASIPRNHVYRFPQVRDGRALFALHLCAVKQVGAVNAIRLPAREQMHASLLEGMRAEYAGQIATGYLQLNETRDQYVATWKGAYLMTWPHLWPLKTWQRARRHRRAATMIRKWGVDLQGN